LFAYLALAPHPVSRSRLCELLWDVPNDPRGELRWCLSKLRRALDDAERSRIVTAGEMVALDLAGWQVDAHEIEAACGAGIERPGLERLGLDQLRALAALFTGEFLEGLEIDRSPHFDNWLMSQRRRFQGIHLAMLERIVACLPRGADEAMPYLERWIAAAPFDDGPHIALLGALAQRGQFAAGDAHLETTARLFDAEGLDVLPLRAAWRSLRERRPREHRLGGPPRLQMAGAGEGQTGICAVPGGDRRDPLSDAALAPRAAPRASLAVMPFTEMDDPRGSIYGEPRGGLADGLTHDIITRLAKLRNLFIIARGSVFALSEQRVTPDEAARRLKVDYIATGSLRQAHGRITVSIELVEARTARIVWAEVFDQKLDNAFLVLDEMGNRIVASIANEIEMVERNRAVLLPPNSLDAWSAYHRGLWHMYRFTRDDNEQAQHFFRRAVALDPTFARAHAGLSFTHWQNAFQHWSDRQQESDRAFETASQSLMVDEHNPAAHWAMGRALWLRGRQADSLAELERAVDLSPNFALGHYALSFVQSQSGDPRAAIRASDHSRHLSPFDPLLFGMLGARAMSHVRLGQFEEAAEWALKAATRPNAHVIILAIAAHCLGLAGRVEEGRAFAAAIHKTLPHYRIDDFLQTFQFPADAAALFRQGAKHVGLG
ncbi:MAG TPA: hypothetical protein VM639_01335, partial [Dongiaceae bacterium]|nr:hypothetical protein [Dongiaceae bacterium]